MSSHVTKIWTISCPNFEYRVDGILLTAATLSSAMAHECARLGVPVTLFNRSVPDAHASSFCCDNIEGGRMAARLLMKSGHHQFAFVAGSHDTSTSLERERGFREELKTWLRTFYRDGKIQLSRSI